MPESEVTTEQRVSFPLDSLDDFTDLSSEHWYKVTGCFCSTPEGDPIEGPHGLIVPHLTTDGHWCSIAIVFRDHSAQLDDGHSFWDVTSEDPLTITPDLVCTECSDHGTITDGEWGDI